MIYLSVSFRVASLALGQSYDCPSASEVTHKDRYDVADVIFLPIFSSTSHVKCTQRVVGFSKVLATFNHVGGSPNHLMATTGCVWIIPSFRISGYVLYVEHSSCVITNCDQHLKSSWGLTGGKHYQKMTIASFRFVLQKFIIPGYFPYILFYSCLFPYFLLVGSLLQYVALFQSSELVKV